MLGLFGGVIAVYVVGAIVYTIFISVVEGGLPILLLWAALVGLVLLGVRGCDYYYTSETYCRKEPTWDCCAAYDVKECPVRVYERYHGQQAGPPH